MASIRTKLGLALAAAVLASFAFGATALAKPVVTKLTIGVNGAKSKFLGKIKSSKASCEKNRRIKLYYKPGPSGSFNNLKNGRSTNSGKWKINGITGIIPTGRYYVKVSGGGRCPSAKSDTIKVN